MAGIFGWFKKSNPENEQSPSTALNENTQKPEHTNQQNTLNESVGVVGTSGNPSFGVGDLAGFEGNFVGDSFYDTGGVFGRPFGSRGLMEVEKAYIMHQRTISLYPEVAIAIEEIMRDIFKKEEPFELITPESDDKSDLDQIFKLYDSFKEKPFTVLGPIKTPTPLITFNFIKQSYVDGRIMILSLLIDKEQLAGSANPTNHPGQRFLNESLVHYVTDKTVIVNPDNINENTLVSLLESLENKEKKKKKRSKSNKDAKDDSIKLHQNQEQEDNSNKVRVFIPIDPMRVSENDGKIYYSAARATKVEVDPKNIIQSDFGLFDVVGARHGFLLYAFKYANQLQELQDMLVPLRFRRSIARRVFNVDISNLPQNRAVSYMQDLQNKFKYKKHYDVKSGKIVGKQDEQTGIVEDYWFANRSGNKGTTVENIDEASNFSDSLDDISYFNKKLYQSMFIPLRRIFESDASYDYTANSIEVDELRFINFLERLRFVYNTVLTEMFSQVMKDHQIPEELIRDVRVQLNFDDWYTPAKIKEDFEQAISLYDDAKPLIGKILSAETVISKVFGMNAIDVAEEFEKIKTEITEASPYHAIYLANKEEDDNGY